MPDSLGLYIHIPFCPSKCPYCDFFSIRGKNDDYLEYVNALNKNIKLWSNKIHKPVDTVYFGGGTPSVIGADLLCSILNTIKANFNVTKNAEITFEANPNTGKFFDFEKARETGFNRISIGLQSANNNELKLLGRTHNISDVINTINLSKKAGFSNISLDLMVGIPEQTTESLKNSIDFCVNNEVTHISSYILKLEENTVFYKRQDKLNLPDDDKTAELYLFAVDYLRKNGFIQYEISNFSKPAYESKHNLKYWNLEEYLGIGPGAHSLLNNKRFYYNNSFEDFYNNAVTDDCICDTEEEYIMLQMRLSKGLNFEEYKKFFGHNLPEELITKAKKYEKLGFLKVTDTNIRFTTKGFLVSNTIIADLI
ncbi:MAG: radical SAM family heme chaperone HemW [Ruminococcus sp.]